MSSNKTKNVTAAMVPLSIPLAGADAPVAPVSPKKTTAKKTTQAVATPAQATGIPVPISSTPAKATAVAGATAVATQKTSGWRYFWVFLISSLIFFLLFLLLKPDYLMNKNIITGAKSYNWGKLILASLVSGLIVLLIVWAASALAPCK